VTARAHKRRKARARRRLRAWERRESVKALGRCAECSFAFAKALGVLIEQQRAMQDVIGRYMDARRQAVA